MKEPSKDNVMLLVSIINVMYLYNIYIESIDYFTDSVCTCAVSIFQTTLVV